MKIVEGFNKARDALSRRGPSSDMLENDDLEKTVRQIIDEVRRRGDVALIDYTQKFDGVKLTALEVDKTRIDNALNEIDKELLEALKLAAARIGAYHLEQKKALLRDSKSKKLGWIIRPIEKVGVIIPGSQAPLPSSLLMSVIPAKVAGVKDIVLTTPPGKQGSIAPVMLAAASIAGVSRVFSIGGAQAVAALAYGTESVPGVDKICGPGAIYGQVAKKLVYGEVDIDGLYGPSEALIIADDTANPVYCAADLLAQAEHGSGASSILITISRQLSGKVNREIELQISSLQRSSVIKESLEKTGMIIIVNTIEEAIELADLYAPEHLCLVVKNASGYVSKVKNAGCLFIGENSIEAIVDYVAGPSHVLPTGGTARFGSGLNILDFVKLINLVDLDAEDIRQLGKATSIIARAEGLDAHARAVEKRLQKD